MSLKLIGEITHGEKYEKDGQDKWKNTRLGTLWKDEEKGEYVVKYLGQWCKVWPPKSEGKNSPQDIGSSSVAVDDLEDEIPF